MREYFYYQTLQCHQNSLNLTVTQVHTLTHIPGNVFISVMLNTQNSENVHKF